jgi:methionyl-tRNA formyltransferase
MTSLNKQRLKVVFLGNHNVGIEALKALKDACDVCGVVAHPLDAEEGVVYASLADFSRAADIPVIRGKASDPEVLNFIKKFNPDLIWITDYKFLVPKELIALAPKGCINLHPSLLPKYRGRAPINWAIIHGEKEVGLTAHFVDEGVDTGPIIEQEQVTVSDDEYIGDILNKLYPIYYSLSEKVLRQITNGTADPKPQDITNSKIYPRRKPEDGKIDWSKSAQEIRNLVRAVSKPYPGAFFFYEGKKYTVWRCQIEPLPLDTKTMGIDNGTIVSSDSNSIKIKCSDALICCTDFETA